MVCCSFVSLSPRLWKQYLSLIENRNQYSVLGTRGGLGQTKHRQHGGTSSVTTGSTPVERVPVRVGTGIELLQGESPHPNPDC